MILRSENGLDVGRLYRLYDLRAVGPLEKAGQVYCMVVFRVFSYDVVEQILACFF